MPMTFEELKEAGFTTDSWPDDLPTPGEEHLSVEELEGTERRFRFEVTVDGTRYGHEVELDTATVPNPAEGVSFMLNQFAFLWRSNRDDVAVQNDGSVRRIDF